MSNARAYNAVEHATSDDHERVTVEPGPFPLDALSGVQGAIVEETAHVHQIDVALPGMAAVATLAGAIGKGHVIHGAVNSRSRTYCNVYALACAPKSHGKGSVAGEIVSPIEDASHELAKVFRESDLPALKREQQVKARKVKKLVGLLSGDGDATMTEIERLEIESEVDRMQARLDEIEALVGMLPTYYAGSVTPARLVLYLARNGEAIFSYSREAGELLRIALGKFTKDGQADMDLFLSGYSVEPFQDGRMSRGDHYITPCISLLWFVQPSLFRELAANDEALERGMTARCLAFVCEHDTIPEDDGVDRYVSDQARDGWSTLVNDVLSTRTATEPTVIQCSPEARDVFRQWHNESVRLRNGQYRDIKDELGRWREQAIRLAGGQCVADRYALGPDGGGLTLTADHAHRGVALARWACYSTLAMMEHGRQERRLSRAQSLVRLVTDAGGKVTLRDLRDRHGFGKDEVIGLARDYPELLAVQRIGPGESGGRPSEVLTIPGRS